MKCLGQSLYEEVGGKWKYRKDSVEKGELPYDCSILPPASCSTAYWVLDQPWATQEAGPGGGVQACQRQHGSVVKPAFRSWLHYTPARSLTPLWRSLIQPGVLRRVCVTSQLPVAACCQICLELSLAL